jgi:raffinose/stachyose/melibiose transport system substrate-binding protein
MSKKTARISAMAVVSAFAVAALAACGTGGTGEGDGGSDEPLIYLIPSSWANFPGLKENIEAFSEESGVEVEVQGLPDEQYQQSLRSKLASGSGVDIFAGPIDQEDPSDYMVEITDPSFKDRMTPAVFDSMVSGNGKLYSIPSADGLSSFGVFYNKDVFEAAGVTEAPATLDELTDAFTAVKESGVTPLFLSGKDGWTLLQHRNAVDANFLADDEELADKLAENAATWTEVPGFTEQYEALRGWATAGLTNADQLTASYEQGLQALADGTAGAIINGSWVIGPLRANNAEGNYGFFALPNPEGDTKIGLSQPNLMHIAKNSKQQDKARELLEFLIEPENAEPYLAKNPGLSAYTDVSIGEADPVLAEIQAWVDEDKAGAHFDNALIFPAPQEDIIAAYQELVAGRIDVAEFGKRYDAAWVNAGKTAGLDGF